MTINGIEYDDEDLNLYADGSVHDATLTRAATVQGLPCRGGTSVVYDEDGRLKLAFLAEPTDVHGVPCGEGVVYLHPNGAVLNATVTRDTRIGGIVVPARERVTLEEDGGLYEYSTSLPHDGVFGGLVCAAGYRVWRYADGRVSRAVIAEPADFDGVHYPRGSDLCFDTDGTVIVHGIAVLDTGKKYKQTIHGAFAPEYT